MKISSRVQFYIGIILSIFGLLYLSGIPIFTNIFIGFLIFLPLGISSFFMHKLFFMKIPLPLSTFGIKSYRLPWALFLVAVIVYLFGIILRQAGLQQAGIVMALCCIELAIELNERASVEASILKQK
jgi:hypothetical protein